MAYDNVTDANSVGRAIPEAVSGEILKNVPQQSAALQFFRRIPMSTRTQVMNVLSALPVGFFVSGDTGLKQTTELEWQDRKMYVEEIATILPVPINVIDDMSFDIWAEARPLIEEAFGRVLDNAVFFGVNKPSTWPAAVVPAAVAASNYVDLVSGDMPGQTAWGPKYADKISDTFSKVEDDGYAVTGVVVPRTIRGIFRKIRNNNGDALADLQGGSYDGISFQQTMDGMWPSGSGAANLIAGDFTKGIIGLRKDMTYEIFREGVITDNTGAIIFNLMQQDMVAMRVTFRVAFQTVNPVSFANLDAASRYPFAVLRLP